MKVTLPGNTFGAVIMLMMILCIVLVPLSIVAWLVSLIAPWWVATPCAIMSSLVTFVLTVKFKG